MPTFAFNAAISATCCATNVASSGWCLAIPVGVDLVQ